MKKYIITLLIAASLPLTACESKEAKEAVQAASAVGSSVTASEAMASETPEMSPEDLGYGDPEKTGQQFDEVFNNGWEFHSAGTRDPEAYDAVQKFGPTWIYNGKNDSGEPFRLLYSCGGGSLGSGFAIYSTGFETRYSKSHPYEFVITNNGDYLRRNIVTKPEKHPTFDKLGNRISNTTTAGFKRYVDVNYNLIADVNVGGITDDTTGIPITYTDPRRLVNGELGNRLAVQGISFTENVTDLSHHDAVYGSYAKDPNTYRDEVMSLFEENAINKHILENTYTYRYSIPAVISDPASEKYFRNGNICDLVY